MILIPCHPGSLKKCDYTTVDYIMVNYEAKNMTDGIRKYISGTDIDLETE